MTNNDLKIEMSVHIRIVYCAIENFYVFNHLYNTYSYSNKTIFLSRVQTLQSY